MVLSLAATTPEPALRDYGRSVRALQAAKVPFVIGGTWALDHYTPLGRPALDLDLMIEPAEVPPAVAALGTAGARLVEQNPLQTTLTLPNGEVSLVTRFAQGEYAVDAQWRQRAVPGRLFDVAVLIASPADLLWTKVFIAARHRFDGADVVHLLRATHDRLDWHYLAGRLRPYPELLLAYLNLFEFVYPDQRGAVPEWLWTDLFHQIEIPAEPGAPQVCRGTLLDPGSFQFDLIARGFEDARLT
jgi:hypothetical protein